MTQRTIQQQLLRAADPGALVALALALLLVVVLITGQHGAGVGFA